MARKWCSGLNRLIENAGYAVQTAVEEGDPKSKIIDQAIQWKAELIVMGSHGRKGVDRFFMGSVAESVCAMRIALSKSCASLRVEEFARANDRSSAKGGLLGNELKGVRDENSFGDRRF